MIFLQPAIVSFLITIILTPFAIKFARKFNLVDDPKIRPHPAHTQKRVVPRAGGLSLFLAIILSQLFFIPFREYTPGIISALTILLLVGLLDDKYKNLSPYFRLIAQFFAASLLVFSGVSIQFITNPMGGIIHFSPQIAGLISIVWVVWVMNMLNWSKGVDGQMPGIATVAAIILGLLSVKLSFLSDPVQTDVAKLAFITAGSSLGFLIYNWYPAKIFPGFSGSAILGFMVATLAILAGAKLATAGLVLLIPATDFVYIFFRRILQGKSPVWGDKGHLHHKLLEIGLTHRQISLFYILGSVILGAIALSVSSQGKLFAAILVATIILGGIAWLSFFGEFLRRRAPDNG